MAKDWRVAFWQKVRRRGREDCWEWMGRITEHGYGSAYNHLLKKNEGAYRVAYRLSKGEIEIGMMIRHTCDNRPCCNPNHLIPGTARDNSRDAVERGRLRRSRTRPPTDPWPTFRPPESAWFGEWMNAAGNTRVVLPPPLRRRSLRKLKCEAISGPYRRGLAFRDKELELLGAG